MRGQAGGGGTRGMFGLNFTPQDESICVAGGGSDHLPGVPIPGPGGDDGQHCQEHPGRTQQEKEILAREQFHVRCFIGTTLSTITRTIVKSISWNRNL